MSEENETQPITHLITDEALRKIFSESKSNDLTQAQFEQEKTKRIAALCEALKAVASLEPSNQYGSGPRDQIMTQLNKTCDSIYQPWVPGF